jgi:hypothetical protein
MLDPIINFFSRIFFLIGRSIGLAVAWILWPFLKLAAWYKSTGFLWQAIVGLIILALIAGYGWFFYNAETMPGYNRDYIQAYKLDDRRLSAGEEVVNADANAKKTCGRSALVDVVADLTDFNVNQNSWIPSMLLYKSGLFGLDWDATPFFDNKASFQRGIHKAVQRTSYELVNNLGRVRGTSQIDPDLERGNGQLQYDMKSWYVGINPPGFKQATPSAYRVGIESLRKFNDRLASCDATFDARADNLASLLGSITSDIGSTSVALDKRARDNNRGWFDTRADNYYWEAMGQLYGYYGIVHAAGADFEGIIKTKALEANWKKMEGQLRTALDLDPFIVSNGREDGWMMPTHLTTLGFKILEVRTSLVESRDILSQ